MIECLWVLGPAGTYTHEAAITLINARPDLKDVKLGFVDRIDEIFHRVLMQPGHYGLIPMQHTGAGLVSESLSYWLPLREQSDLTLHIIDQCWVQIRHHLLAPRHIKSPSELNRIYSHDLALQQCRPFLAGLGKHTEATSSTAKAVSTVAGVAGEGFNYGALGSKLAAEIYNLNVLKEDAQGETVLNTQFYLLARHPAASTGNDQTAILFSTKERSGALKDVVSLIAEANANMTSIQSITMRRGSDYVFYVEFTGHREDTETRWLLNKLEQHTTKLLVLGSFPQDTHL